jgi:hypothetical protein
MSLSEREIDLIIERVKQEVDEKTNTKTICSCNASTKVLIPSFVPSPEKAIAAIVEHYGKDFELVFISPVVFQVNGVQSKRIDWKTQLNELVDLIVNAKTVVLLAPSTGLLRRIGSGQEEEGVGELLLRRILWGKPFDVLIDFASPKFRRGTYYAQISDAIDALSSLGVRFATYQPTDEPAKDLLSLLTEQDIVDAKRNGCKTITCTKNAIVTPLAVDAAKECRINIEYA